MLTTREMKASYRKGVARLRHEQDPLRRHLLLQMTYALKVDMAKRIKFKGKRSIWKRIVSNIEIVKRLNQQYIADGAGKPVMIEGDRNDEDFSDYDSERARIECMRISPEDHDGLRPGSTKL